MSSNDYLSRAIAQAIETHDIQNIHYVFRLGATSTGCHGPFGRNIQFFTHEQVQELITTYPQLMGDNGELVIYVKFRYPELFPMCLLAFFTRIKDTDVFYNQFENFVISWINSSRDDVDIYPLLQYYLFERARPITEDLFNVLMCSGLPEYNSFLFFKNYVENFKDKRCEEIKSICVSDDVIRYVIRPYLDCGILKSKKKDW